MIELSEEDKLQMMNETLKRIHPFMNELPTDVCLRIACGLLMSIILQMTDERDEDKLAEIMGGIAHAFPSHFNYQSLH